MPTWSGRFGFSTPSAKPDRQALFVVPPTAGSVDVESLCGRLVSMLRSTPAGVVRCDVSALGAGLEDVEAVARLQLTARRRGARIWLCSAPGELAGLLACLGLAGVVPLMPVRAVTALGQASDLEPLQPEEGE
jgi:hypothetical protein